MAKSLATEAAATVAGEAVQVHGAMGVTWEHDLHLLMRRGKHCQLALGSPDSHVAEIAGELISGAARGKRQSDVSLDVVELTPADEAFVAELRDWLDKHLTPLR